jgi:hypothetical protein
MTSPKCRRATGTRPAQIITSISVLTFLLHGSLGLLALLAVLHILHILQARTDPREDLQPNHHCAQHPLHALQGHFRRRTVIRLESLVELARSVLLGLKTRHTNQHHTNIEGKGLEVVHIPIPRRAGPRVRQ